MIIANLLKRAVQDKFSHALPQAKDTKPKAALIFGGGATAGIGGAVALRIAAGGLPVYITGRSLDKLNTTVAAINQSGGQASAIQVDASDEAQIIAAFEQVENDGFSVDLVVHNVGTNRPSGFMQTTPEMLEHHWRNDCLSGFFVGQQAAKRMQPRGRGTILFTGASASLRGKAQFGAFAAAKSGLRIMAQSMARDFGPKGIHVAHIIIDGIVDGERLRQFAPQLIAAQGDNGALNPTAIAETYWQIYQQHRTAWTHELDLRPFKESW